MPASVWPEMVETGTEGLACMRFARWEARARRRAREAGEREEAMVALWREAEAARSQREWALE